MCDFCEHRSNITAYAESVQRTFSYCPVCGASLCGSDEYFILMRGGEDIRWIDDLDDIHDPEVMSYVMEHSHPDDFADGILVYTSHPIAEIQGYPKVVRY